MELYESDLTALQGVMGYLEDISRIDSIFSVEIRIKVDDVDSWAVIGWGEAGDPCILRFEQDPPKPILRPVGGKGVHPFTTLYRSADEID